MSSLKFIQECTQKENPWLLISKETTHPSCSCLPFFHHVLRHISGELRSVDCREDQLHGVSCPAKTVWQVAIWRIYTSLGEEHDLLAVFMDRWSCILSVVIEQAEIWALMFKLTLCWLHREHRHWADEYLSTGVQTGGAPMLRARTSPPTSFCMFYGSDPPPPKGYHLRITVALWCTLVTRAEQAPDP